MIAVRTTADWPSCQITLDNGVDPPQVWTCVSTAADAYAAAEDFAIWTATAFPGESTAGTWSFDDNAEYGVITLSFSLSTYDVTANAAAQSVLGSETGLSGASDLSWLNPSGVLMPRAMPYGSSAPAPYTSEALQWTSGVARAASVGATAERVNATGPTRLSAAYAASPRMVTYLRAALEAAANPRSAALYDAAAATWRDVALGRVTVRQNNPAMYRVDLDVVEGA